VDFIQGVPTRSVESCFDFLVLNGDGDLIVDVAVYGFRGCGADIEFRQEWC
jgi:hypothetical protein